MNALISLLLVFLKDMFAVKIVICYSLRNKNEFGLLVLTMEVSYAMRHWQT